MSCERYEHSILDDAESRPADFETHVGSCSSCRSLREAHRGALCLEGVTPSRIRTPRAALGRPVLVGGLLLAAAALAAVLVVWPRRATPPAEGAQEATASSIEFSKDVLRVGESAERTKSRFDADTYAYTDADADAVAEDVSLEELARLDTEVSQNYEQDVTRHDDVLLTFGALALWVAPSESSPMNDVFHSVSSNSTQKE
jgi:hypothetical protein